MMDTSTSASDTAKRVGIGALAFIAVLTLCLLLWWRGSPQAPAPILHGAPVGYSSVSDMLKSTDVTLVVRVVSKPTQYVDFGADGKPDYEDQAGLPVELVTAEVVQVLRGEQSLVGSQVVVSQPSLDVQYAEGSRAMDRLELGQEVLIVGTGAPANPGVGKAGSTIYTPAPWGQGIYDVAGDNVVTARVDDVLGGDIRTGREIDESLFVESKVTS